MEITGFPYWRLFFSFFFSFPSLAWQPLGDATAGCTARNGVGVAPSLFFSDPPSPLSLPAPNSGWILIGQELTRQRFQLFFSFSLRIGDRVIGINAIFGAFRSSLFSPSPRAGSRHKAWKTV